MDRSYCSDCRKDKASWPSKADADAVLAQYAVRVAAGRWQGAPAPTRSYNCPAGCGWHHSSKPARTVAAPAPVRPVVSAAQIAAARAARIAAMAGR